MSVRDHITIPNFVMAGLANSNRPDLASIYQTRYRTEADLRDAMAAHWWLHGWTVRTEVKVPDCGRIDVLAESADASIIVELKKAIRTPTQARQAFQQAHAYLVYLEYPGVTQAFGTRRSYSAIVTAGEWELGAINAADQAYHDVAFLSFGETASQATAPHDWQFRIGEEALSQAARIARLRRQQIETLALASGAAVNRLTIAREAVAA